LLGLLLGLASMAACGATKPSDAAAQAPNDAAAEAPSDAAVEALADAAGDMSSDAAPACPSIESYCAKNHCVSDWSDAENPSTWCTTDAGTPSDIARYGNVYIHMDCGGFDLVVLGGVDTATFYLYDLGTGNLVAVGANNLGGQRCLAGTLPPPFSFACGDGGIPTNACGP
jgi:hypothetical protein